MSLWSVPASQGVCERAWARNTRIASPIRNRLHGDTKEKLHFVESNWQLIAVSPGGTKRVRPCLPSAITKLSRDLAIRARAVAGEAAMPVDPEPAAEPAAAEAGGDECDDSSADSSSSISEESNDE